MFRKLVKLKILKLTALFLLLFPWAGKAQDNISFEAFTDAKQVVLNGYFEVTFILKNANGTEFTPPPFKDFTVLAGPGTMSSTSIINGAITREMGYTYTLQPQKPGKFTIGSASVRANGKKIESAPVSIEVVKGAAGTAGQASGEEAVFVRLEVNKTDLFIGEQLLLDFKLYTSVPIDGYDIREEPEYQGFYAQELKRFDSRTLREVINGKQFTTKVLRRIALFPQQTGTMNISPARIQLAIVEENDRTGFFFNRSVRPVFFTTNSLEINVSALPPGSPQDFSGAVGNYDFQASIDQKQLSTDDAFTVKLFITGDGDVKRIQPPVLLLSDSFEVYSPRVISDTLLEEQGALLGKKMFEYLVLPSYPGDFLLTPSFTYFDNEQKKYVTKRSDTFDIKIRQGSDKHSPADGDPARRAAAKEDIHFIKTNTTLKQRQSPLISNPVFLGLSGFPLIVLVGVLFFRKKQKSKDETDYTLLKKKLASKEAQKRLAIAHQLLQNGNHRAFYDEISKASLGYVCDKLEIPLSQLTKENVREKLLSLNVSDALISDFIHLLEQCEMALFAGIKTNDEMQVNFEKALSVIANIEEEIGRMEA